MIRWTEVIFIGWPAANGRQIRKLWANEMKSMLRWWHAHMLKGHFRGGAFAKYGYAKRSASYLKKKRRLHKPMGPMVYDGLLRSQSTRFARTKANYKQAVLTMTVPWYVKAVSRRKRHPGPDLEKELIVTTEKERNRLVSDFEKRVAKRLNSMPHRRRRRLAA